MCGGIAVAIKALYPSIRVIAAEPQEADDAFRSKAAGTILPHRCGLEQACVDVAEPAPL